MANDPNPAIELLVAQIAELERKANAYRASVNVLCERDGLPPMFPDSGGSGGDGMNGSGRSREPSITSVQVKPDSFYKKPQQTAVRELLAIRKAAGNGPAKPSEILEGLRAGGYQVEAKNDDIALVGLRAMLRKRTNVFHKLPNGAWGLMEWYPNAKPPKEAADKGASSGKESPAQAPDVSASTEEAKEADTEASAA
jgi:hypothetical protein